APGRGYREPRSSRRRRLRSRGLGRGRRTKQGRRAKLQTTRGEPRPIEAEFAERERQRRSSTASDRWWSERKSGEEPTAGGPTIMATRGHGLKGNHPRAGVVDPWDGGRPVNETG